MNARISLIMINRNRSPYIRDAINSVLAQKCDDWELIIVDDNSNDNSKLIIESFLSDGRITFIPLLSHQGIVHARNIAVSATTSGIVGIIDSDDVLENNAVATMLEYHAKNDHGLIYSQLMVCDENLKPIRLGTNRQPILAGGNLIENCVSHFVTFKKWAFEIINGYDPFFNRCSEDKDLFYRMEEITNILFVDQILYYYRTNPTSISSYGMKKYIGKILHFIAKYRAYKRRMKSGSPKQIKFFELFAKLNKNNLLCKK